MSSAPTLDRLQQWMLAVITHPDGIAAGIDGDDARQQIPIAADGVEQVVDRSAACSAIERLGVYGNAYFARLLECLHAEYNVLVQAMGAEGFTSLAAGYLQRYPSTSYTLSQLGAQLPQYLDETRPPRDHGDTAPDWADFLIDLARLERTYTEVFDGPGDRGRAAARRRPLAEPPPRHVGNGPPADGPLATAAGAAVPGPRGLRRAAGRGECPPFAPRTVRLAISRRNYIVQSREVSPFQFTLLQRLIEGEPLDAALGATLESLELDPDGLAESLTMWFQDWTAERLICGLILR